MRYAEGRARELGAARLVALTTRAPEFFTGRGGYRIGGKEDLPDGHIRDFPLELDGVRVIALNVTKLRADNVDPREYMTLEPDVSLLERAARVTGGVVDPSVDVLFDPGDERIEHHEELWPRVLFLALILFVLDLLLRRVRLFDRKFKGARMRRS